MVDKIKYFDVSLRDGLQSIKEIYSLEKKKYLLNEILKKYNPDSIEIGSIVSSKIMPQMGNSLELYKYTQELNIQNVYLLTPNLKSIYVALNNNVKNFSLITSVSDEFQKKNINKTLIQTKDELKDIISLIKKNKDTRKIKLYVSCINECPIQGKINNKTIIEELDFYVENFLKSVDEICLSDTCGTLSFYDFKEIIDNLNKSYGEDFIKKISLHLHKNKNDNNLNNILKYAILNGIYRIDVSCLESGGCSITIDENKLNNNLHYDDIKKILC